MRGEDNYNFVLVTPIASRYTMEEASQMEDVILKVVAILIASPGAAHAIWQITKGAKRKAKKNASSSQEQDSFS